MLTGLIEFFTRTQTPAFIVGGCLRDSLLSLPPGRDVDIAVAGDVQILAKELARSFGGTLVPLSPERSMMRVVVPHPGADIMVLQVICTSRVIWTIEEIQKNHSRWEGLYRLFTPVNDCCQLSLEVCNSMP